MGTRRWLGELERWIWTKKLTKEDVARRSGHDVGHVLDLFTMPDPNPTLRLYLDLLEAAGARMDTANGNSVGHVVSRIGELRNRAGLTVSELARRSGVGRTHLSGLLNGSKTNMQLGIFDVLITTLGAEEEMRLVERYYNSQLMRLALAAGAETVAAGDGPARPHLHAVPNPGASPPRSAGSTQSTAAGRAVDPSGAAEPARGARANKAADPPGEAPRSQTSDGERHASAEPAAAEPAAAERAAADRAAQEKVRADEAEVRAAQERLRAEQEKGRAEQERLRAEQERARAKAAAEQAAQVAAHALLTDRLLIAGGLTMMVVGGVMVYKGLSSHPA